MACTSVCVNNMPVETTIIEVKSSETIDESEITESTEHTQVSNKYEVNQEQEKQNADDINISNNNNCSSGTEDIEKELSLVWKPVLSDVCQIDFCDCSLPHKIPGKEGYTITNLISILRNGHKYFADRIRRFNSSVYIMYLSGQRTLLNDSTSIQTLFNEDVVRKEESFGFQVFNRAALDYYRPLIFQNDQKHRNNKAIFLQYMNYVKDMYDTSKLMHVIAYELDNLSMSSTLQTDFEDSAFLFTCNVLTKILLGTTLHYPYLKCWLRECLVKKIYKPKLNKETETAYKKLLEEIKAAPYFTQLCNINGGNLDEDDLARELIMMLTVNAMGAITNTLLSSIIYLSKLSSDERELLESESDRFKETKDMKDLHYTEGFLLEVLRLHPPAHKIFAVSSKEFVLQSDTGQYFIPKDMLLSGNIYQSQRSEKHFENPEIFNLKRFIDGPHLKKFLFSFGGSFDKDLKAPHHCLAQHLSMSILKVCIVKLCAYNITFRSQPYWSGSKYKRFAASDKPLEIKTFVKKDDRKKKRLFLAAKADML